MEFKFIAHPPHFTAPAKDCQEKIAKNETMLQSLNLVRIDSIDGLLTRLEKTHIRAALQRHRGDIVSAAKTLGKSRGTIYRKIKEYKLGNFWLECRKVKA